MNPLGAISGHGFRHLMVIGYEGIGDVVSRSVRMLEGKKCRCDRPSPCQAAILCDVECELRIQLKEQRYSNPEQAFMKRESPLAQNSVTW
jgi:hypothetical protein